MKKINKKISVILLSLALITTQNAFAARFGKSRNVGMQRSTTTQTAPAGGNNYRSYNNQQSQQTTSTNPQSAAQPQRSGPGVGGVVAGAAAGAVGGYLLGKAMNSNNNNQTASGVVQQQQTASNNSAARIPWGIIAILGILLVIGLIIFRRKASAGQAMAGSSYLDIEKQNNRFDIPGIQRELTNPTPAPTESRWGKKIQPTVISGLDKMADGVEVQYFLRQVKGVFLHIQSMNNEDNVEEIAKYMTSELYQDVAETIKANRCVADFVQLDCQLEETTVENKQIFASVKFFGKVSEDPKPEIPPVSFAEIWNFVKTAEDPNARWLLAGIEQVIDTKK